MTILKTEMICPKLISHIATIDDFPWYYMNDIDRLFDLIFLDYIQRS